MPARLRDRYPPAYAGSVGVRKKLQSWGRLMLGMPSFLKTGQIGDGREAACAAHVETAAPTGDIDAALAAIDTFARDQAMLVNIGDEKGVLLDAAVHRVLHDLRADTPLPNQQSLVHEFLDRPPRGRPRQRQPLRKGQLVLETVARGEFAISDGRLDRLSELIVERDRA